MAGFAFTNAGEAYVLDWLCRSVVPTKLNLWLGCLTTNPSETGTGSEVTGGAYARQQLVSATGAQFTVFGSIVVNPAPQTGSHCANTVDISFPIATANWGNITHIGIWDSQAGGIMIAYKELAVPQQIDRGQEAKFPTGRLKITAD